MPRRQRALRETLILARRLSRLLPMALLLATLILIDLTKRWAQLKERPARRLKPDCGFCRNDSGKRDAIGPAWLAS